MTLALAASAHAAGKVRVCVNSSPHVPAFVLARAEFVSSRMLATAGVALEWRSAAPAICQGPQQTRTVVLDVTTNTPPSESPGALAYALPYGHVHLVVLFDRIEKSVDRPTQLSPLLAHVMTHEITHLLQGTSRHSKTGVMKAHWDADDLWQMAYKPLAFTPEDIDLIQRGLHSQAAGPASAAPSSCTAEAH